MKTLRITLLAALALVAAASPALAQRGPRGPGRGSRGPGSQAVLLQGITLTDAQRARIDSIHASAVGRMAASRAHADSTVRAERWAAAAERQAAMRAVLTPEQQAVWDRNLEQRTASREQMRANRDRMRADRARMGWHRHHRW